MTAETGFWWCDAVTKVKMVNRFVMLLIPLQLGSFIKLWKKTPKSRTEKKKKAEMQCQNQKQTRQVACIIIIYHLGSWRAHRSRPIFYFSCFRWWSNGPSDVCFFLFFFAGLRMDNQVFTEAIQRFYSTRHELIDCSCLDFAVLLTNLLT